MRHLLSISLLVAATSACTPSVSDLGGGNGHRNSDKNSGQTDPPAVAGIDDDWGLEPVRLDYFEPLLKGDAQYAALCARGNADRVTNYFCQTPRPQITSLEQLLVGLGLKNPANPGQMRFAISGHSSSLVTTKTTVINPRAIIFTQAGAAADYVALGFVRGDGFAELAAFDTVNQRVNFFVVKIHKACDPECSNFERFSPEAETGWSGITVYGDPDLKNTALDCLQCHQPGGVNGTRMLRMQELQDPWTHWFRDNRPSLALLNKFQQYHPGETFAGIPANLVANSDPADLEDFVRAGGFDLQPNEFQTDTIADELAANPDQIPPTWMEQYNRALAGTEISTPFFMISPYDEAKVDAAGLAYQEILSGTRPQTDMPEMTELFREDAKGLLGFEAGSNLDAKGIVQHRCGTCHAGNFPGISRNNFDVADFPNNLTPDMRDKILLRISMPETSRFRMPPMIFSKLNDEQVSAIEAAIHP